MVSSREGRRRAVEGSVDQHDEAGSQNEAEAGDQEPRVREAGAGERDENFNEEDPESQESDFETNLSRRASRNAKNRGGGDGDDEEYVEAKIPKDILKRVMPVGIREGLTIRQVVMMTSAVLVGSGADLKNFTLSTSTCWRETREQCSTLGDQALEKYVEEVKEEDKKVICHFDGKIIEEDFRGKKKSQHRLVSLLTSPEQDQQEHLLGVVPLEQETGYNIALEVYNHLLHHDLENQVAGAVLNSTAANTGIEEGAAIHLQRLLDRPILEIECGHHVQV